MGFRISGNPDKINIQRGDYYHMKVYRGNILYTPVMNEFTVYRKGYVVEKDGKVAYAGQSLAEEYKNEEIIDFGDALIIPGFNDIHVHAPQWCNAGIGFSMELLPWLSTYTFPAEANFNDIDFAEKEYTRFINELLKNGTTRACMFASRHLEATKILFNLVNKSNMGAMIGKVNMNRNCIKELQEDTYESLLETEEIIKWVSENFSDNRNLSYILTPRYVPCSSVELMKGLADIQKKYNLPVQSHLDENRDEVSWVKQLHPECKNFADVYAEYGLMPEEKTIMAHCIYMNEEEKRLLKEKKVLVAHCAMSNADLSSGIMPLRQYLNEGLNVAIASDMGGSHSVSMKEHIVATINTSKLYWLTHPEDKPITFAEGFYLATKAGGSFFGKVGSFEEGYEFDALVIDDSKIRTGINHSITERLERFVYTGSSDCIIRRFVSGKECKIILNEGE